MEIVRDSRRRFWRTDFHPSGGPDVGDPSATRDQGLGRTRPPSPIRLGLAAVTGAVVLYEAGRVLTNFPVSIDLVIPLQAAERWSAGATVYVAEGFTDPAAIPPFLYPPFVLPFLAGLSAIPQEILRWIWLGVMVAVAVVACRRLAMPWWLVPFALAWPPFAEGVWNGNLQIVLFAAFAFAFWEPPPRHDLRPAPRDLDGVNTGPRVGFLAATVGAVKVSQAHAWLVVARHRPRAALLGALPWVGVVLLTLPLTGLGLYLDWLRQASLASDPGWAMIGVPLLVYLPGPIVAAITLASVIVAWRLRGPDAGAWVGLLMLIVSPNLHAFTGLFAIPALLLVRREIALVAVLAMASYLAVGWWLGVGLIAGAMVGARWVPGLRERAVAAPTPS